MRISLILLDIALWNFVLMMELSLITILYTVFIWSMMMASLLNATSKQMKTHLCAFDYGYSSFATRFM